MRKIILVIVLLFYWCSLSAQYTVKWEKIFGDNNTRVYALDSTEQKGLIIQATQNFVTLRWIKADSSGNIVWVKEKDNYWDFGAPYNYDIKCTNDFSFISSAHMIEGNGNLLFTKLDSSGNIIFSNSLGDPTSVNYAYTIIPISDVGFTILSSSGDINSNTIGLDYRLIKVDKAGKELWYKSYTPSNANDYPSNLHVLTDGSYVIGGGSQENVSFTSSSHPFFIKVNGKGDSLTSKRIIVTDEYFDDWYAVNFQPTPEGNYVFVGFYDDTTAGTWRTGYVVKTDQNFNIIWKVFYPVTGRQVQVDDVKVLGDSTYLALVNVIGQKSHLLKINKTGIITNDYTISTPLCVRNYFVEMVLMKDSSLVLLGLCDDGMVFPSNNKPYLLKLGKVGQEYTYNYCQVQPLANFTHAQNGISVKFSDQSLSNLPNGEIFSWQWDLGDGTTSKEKNPSNVYFSENEDSISVNIELIVTSNLGCKDTITKTIKVRPTSTFLERIFPNPFNSTATVSIKSPQLSEGGEFLIFDVLGRVVGEYEIPKQLGDIYYEFTINRFNLSSDMYIYKLTIGNIEKIGKLMIK